MNEIKLNFGAIEESVLRLKYRAFNGERNGVEGFQKVVNENYILKIQQLIFHSLCTEKRFIKQRLAERFITQTIELANGINWGELSTANRDLRITFLDDSHVGSTTYRDHLFNAIHTLIESKCRGFGNYDQAEEQQAIDIIIDKLMNNEQMPIEGSDEPEESWKYITQIALNNFEKRYSHLSETELKLVKILVSENENKKNYLLDLIEELKNKIAPRIHWSSNSDEINTLSLYEQKLNKIDVESVDLDEAIVACFDLKEKLNWK